MALSIRCQESTRAGGIDVKPAGGFRTINVTMLGIDTDPIEATACYCPGLVAAREHLPCAKCQARACFERFLKSVGSLHSGEC